MSDWLDDSIKEYLGQTRAVPPELLKKAKDLVPPSRPGVGKCPHCGKPVTPFKDGSVPGPWNVLWFAAAGAALAPLLFL